MATKKRLVLALVIVLSGFLLVPFVALPRESFRWQLFAGAYGSGPALGTNYGSGGLGSTFLLSGFGFKAGATLTLKANGVVIGTVTVDERGEFRVSLSTTGAGLGSYTIEVDEGAQAQLAAAIASTTFTLVSGAPVRAPVAGVPTTLAIPNVPAAADGQQVWLPLVAK